MLILNANIWDKPKLIVVNGSKTSGIRILLFPTDNCWNSRLSAFPDLPHFSAKVPPFSCRVHASVQKSLM